MTPAADGAGVKDGNIHNNNSECMITGTNIANDHGPDDDMKIM